LVTLVKKVVMGWGQKLLTRVGSGQPFMVWVWIWKISPKNVKFFNFFPMGQKKSIQVGSESTWVKGGSASYILRVKSKLESGQSPSLHKSAKRGVKFRIFIMFAVFLNRDRGKIGWRHVSVCHLFFRPYQWS